MSFQARIGPPAAGRILRALHALNGRATRGDLVMATALPLVAIDGALASLMAADRVQVSVSESAVLVYRLHRPQPPSEDTSAATPRWALPRRLRWERVRSERAHAFDRKTLSLIRARGGVISVAELVEHTGLTVGGAETEARRLARLYGGEPHPSWDGHVVYAFPDLVESAHGAFHVREPRPAWARAEDPMRERHTPWWRRRPLAAGALAVAAGVLGWLATFPPPPGGRAVVLAGVAGASAGAAFALSRGILDRLARLAPFRLRSGATLRRYALGYVFETALKGKGVVSLDRTVAYLRSRSDDAGIARHKVESVLRRLAVEFDAPVTELGGDVFFGFRNVKRQFLASHVQRVRLGLERKAAGRTVFDSGDSELDAAARELEDFDEALRDSSTRSET